MLKLSDITVEETHWGYVCYAVVDGYLTAHKYIGYNKRDARRLFRDMVNGLGE